MNIRKVAMLASVIGLLAASTTGCAVHTHAPPASPVVRTGKVWVPGHWEGNGPNRHWVSGHWKKSGKSRWVRGHWEGQGPNRHWVPGHWT